MCPHQVSWSESKKAKIVTTKKPQKSVMIDTPHKSIASKAQKKVDGKKQSVATRTSKFVAIETKKSKTLGSEDSEEKVPWEKNQRGLRMN